MASDAACFRGGAGGVAMSAAVREEQISIATRGGHCPAHLIGHGGSNLRAAAIIYMDGFGIRPTLVKLAARLAGEGYVVLLPDLYYRFGSYQCLDPAELHASGQLHSVIAPLRATINNTGIREDTGFFLNYLSGRADVVAGNIGVVGFCMGGGFALTAAGAFPNSVVAAASFHGGYLATDESDSPHRLASRMRAEVYVAGAENDGSYPPEMAVWLERALEEAGVDHRCEVYQGAAHGWMIRDSPAWNASAAERGWNELIRLLRRNLG